MPPTVATCTCAWFQEPSGFQRVQHPGCGVHPDDPIARIEYILQQQGQSLLELHRKVDHMTDQQSELNADVEQLSSAVGTIQTAEQANATAVAAVAAAFAAAQQAQPDLDLSGLEAAINGSADGSTPGLVAAAAAVTAGVQAVQGLVPATPAAPDASGDAPA